MNLKKKIIWIVMLSMLITGCSNKDTQESTTADKATQQRTMTKVQNDVNEIMNKDYNYVLENMGTPYCTTYYIDTQKSKLDYINNLRDLDELTNNMRLVYPKEETNDSLERSALYISINNNKVTEVQTFEFTEYDIKRDDVNNNSDIILDTYDDKAILSVASAESIDVRKYIGKELTQLSEVIDLNEANFEAYDRDRKEIIMGYFLSEDGKASNKILNIIESEGNISEISIIERNDILRTVKDYLIK